VVAISAGAISGTSVSTRPSHRKITNRGIQRTLTGIIRASSDSAISHLRARTSAVAITNPASDATRTVMGTATATTSSEFRRKVHNGKKRKMVR
jgi:hypothetical protein